MLDCIKAFIAERPVLFALLLLWTLVWDFISYWKSARNGHLVWFIILALTSTLGILPIIYIFTHRAKFGDVN